MVNSGIPFILFCTVNWFDEERLNIEMGLTTNSEMGLSPLFAHPPLTIAEQ